MKDMDVFTSTCERGSTDFDLISEIISGQTASSLPGPPPPPADLFCQPSSQPLLVARGTARQPTCTFPQPLQHSSRDVSHPSRGAASPAVTPNRVRGSPCTLVPQSSCAVSSPNHGGNPEMLERILQMPTLEVVEQPKERGMRFRYECEGRSAGSILGASSTETTKTQPAIEIQGPIEHLKRVTVTVSLVTKDPPHRPHPHCLVGKDCPNGSGICVITINPHGNRRHSFANLGIQCVKRRELDFSLQKRRSQNIDPFQTGDSKGIEDMDMNAVRLCFQCEFEWDDGRKDSLSPIVSNPIYDKKATTTSQLKITCLNLSRGSCLGKTEIYMLCDKVQKDDIEIIFRRGSWKANGEFAQTDVHRQIAIVFKTPPYQDPEITEEVEVSITLRRLSDQMESEPISFTYLPKNPDPYEVKRKRKFKSDISFTEKPCLGDGAPAAEQTFHFPQPPAVAPHERLFAAQPATSASGEMCYKEHQSANNSAEEAALMNQLMEMPGLWEMISDAGCASTVTAGFEQAPDGNSTYFNMDTNLNFDPYMQDFSHYNDMQLNMLINENLVLQSETQESPSSMVQVKTEEEH